MIWGRFFFEEGTTISESGIKSPCGSSGLGIFFFKMESSHSQTQAQCGPPSSLFCWSWVFWFCWTVLFLPKTKRPNQQGKEKVSKLFSSKVICIIDHFLPNSLIILGDYFARNIILKIAQLPDFHVHSLKTAFLNEQKNPIWSFSPLILLSNKLEILWSEKLLGLKSRYN